MADEVPASDVLCQAMDYLSKLGSNLRLRSENLKEKRISRDKLKNSHAVHKAASKVLLICELSKKSIDNVETGVRKVLGLLEKATVSPNTGGNTSINKSSPSRKSSVHFFDYNSRKLRLASKINVKHYLSAKVLVKRMPTSVQESHPVYIDCKLYRSRKRALKHKRFKSTGITSRRNSSVHKCESDLETGNKDLSTSTTNNDNNISKVTEPSNGKDSCVEVGNNSNLNEEVCPELEDVPLNHGIELRVENSIIQINSPDKNKVNDTIITINDSEIDTPVKESRKCSVDSDDAEKCKDQKNKSSHADLSKIVKKVNRSDATSDEDLSDKSHKTKISKEKSKSKVNEVKKRKYKHFVISDDNSSDDNTRKKKLTDNPLRKKVSCISSEDEKSSDSKKSTLHEPKSKKIKHRHALSSSDEHDEKKNDSDSKVKEDEANNKDKANNKNEVSNKDTANNEDDANSNDVTNNKDKSYTENKANSDDLANVKDENVLEVDNKPLIRCVNISKLLKPDILHKESSIIQDSKSLKLKHSKPKTHPLGKKMENNTEKQTNKKEVDEVDKTKDIKNTTDKVNDDEYWTQKRKEVKVFKSKMFSITITRLPDITINFLLLHNLTRVTQGNAIICEKYKDTNKSDDISKVKNALLNDSESDNEISLLSVVKAKRTKRNLNDSDCDRDTSDKRQYCQADKTNVKNDITKDVEPVSNREVPMNKDTPVTNKGNVLNEVNVSPTKIKNALLNDSDSDRNNECVIQEKIKNIHPNEKKYDSEKIKKALLTGSDSEKKEECVKISQDKECNENEFINKEFEELEKTVSGILNSAGLNDIDSDKNENEIENNTLKEIVDTTQDSREDQSTNVDQQTSNDTHEHHEDVSCGSPKGDVVKDLSSSYTEAVKSSLLNDSSDSMSDGVKEKELSVKKHAKESANAKKKLLNHSSSDHQNSDAESEYSEDSSDENNPKTIKRKCLRKRMRRSYPSSSSNEEHDANKKIKKQSGSSDSVQENTDKDDGSSSQADGTTDQQSKSSSRKMVRSKAKPSGSSGQSSDNQDNSDKDIDGLANLESLNKPSRRRRDSASTTATNNTQDTNSTTKKKSRLKAAAISEDILKAESSSDNISDNENNVHSDVEELPAVGLTGFNGDSIDHLAKDDLLGDTDSSGSPDKDKTEHSQNVDDTEDEDNVKSKRRKANAILSDSEAGSSRRKNRGGKLSDFEDSEDDSSEPVKKSAKRKKVKSDSDGSAASSDDGKKKRRRIKQIDDSDASGSDSETEGRNKHGRKNIRKVMGKNQLEEATKKAAREEKERIARIAERQKLYNNLEFDESGKPDEVVLEKVVLDFDPETKEPLIEVDRGLVKKLKPHQANGIKFMWDACFESVKRIKKDKGSGCILAHCMGLGKTLQVISLTHTLLIHASLTGVNRVLVVCPLSTVLNWVSEFRMWLKHAENDFEVEVYELSRYKQNSERAYQLQSWFECGGVCVLGYEMFRNLSADNSKKYKKKMLKSFQESLVDPGPDLVICDEGHLLKNEKTSLSQSMNRVKTRRRIVLTGTPLQNNLKEYYCMVQFVKPNLLGKYNEYLNRFVNPITNGQYTDSTEHDIKIMKRRSHVLHKMLDGAVQRRDYGVLAPFLPPKHEFVLFITLTEVQIKLYQHYLDNYSRRPQPGKSSGFLFPDFQSLQRIWTHPLVLKYNSERYEIMQQKKREREEEDDSEGSLADFINDDSTPDESTTEESTDDSSVASDDDNRKKTKKKKASKKGKGKATTRRGTRANPEIEDEHTVEEVVEVKNENPTEWWIKLVSDDDELDDMRNSHKLVLLFDILRQCEAIGDKLLVFSQSLYSLDLIEHFLGKVDEATQEGRVDEKLGGHVGSWSPGIDYFRLDGSTSCENRSIWCKNFNREDNPRARLFLISTRAGGLGINLVAANRVVIFDVSWNPSHDVQSIFRVYRFGQKKPCYVYRFLAMGTMEEKIYERQVTKQAISKRVIDEQQIDRHYAENDLAELYKFEPHPPSPRPLPPLPKDRLFAEMLREHETQIYKYHEHDSLLENKEEETLSEEERKAAWEDFENEKNKPPPAPFPSPWIMHNGMVPNLMAQQQQQLAYAALASLLRKDMPNLNENQIRDMLPLIYNSNPGLLQKMADMYKYTQSSMMNPGMMNPVMNPGMPAGGGGTSGLQYEPPWQRQHQQQQIRLQQLLQQNQMGAKFYAGGLGSRDPVAMALQQQRAREIMLGGGGGGSGVLPPGPPLGAGRPRGRPPHVPRQSAAHSSDVVNLDSD